MLEETKRVPEALHEPEQVARKELAQWVELEAEAQGVQGGVQRQPPLLSSEGVVQSHVARLQYLLCTDSQSVSDGP